MIAGWGLAVVWIACVCSLFAAAWWFYRARQLTRRAEVAEKANRAKSRLLAAASHDLLQPLHAARLFNSTLRSRAVADDHVRLLSGRVEKSLLAAEEVLEGLLDIARLDTGAFQPIEGIFDVGELLESLHEQFAPLARQRGIRFEVMPTSALGYSDQRLIRRILQNLIGNALRYTKSGRVLIGVRRRNAGAALELQVCDTGPGIAPEHHETIFEEFQRLSQASPWGEQGLGLGLSICRRIAEALDARLTLRSKVSRGSVFGVVIERETLRHQHDLRSIARAELVHDGPHVSLHGGFGDVELKPNLLVLKTRAQHDEHAKLLRSEA